MPEAYPVPGSYEIVQPRALRDWNEVPLMAVGMPLSVIQFHAQTAMEADAPHFVQGSEPRQDGRAYKAVDNDYFYRPNLRVAQRVTIPAGPEVRFLKDAKGQVRLQFELEEAPQPSMPAGAEPFNVKIEEIALQWRAANGQQRTRVFNQPTFVATDDPADSAVPNFRIVVGTDLNLDEVEALHYALRTPAAGSTLRVRLSYRYWVDEEEAGGSTAFVGELTPILGHLETPILHAIAVDRPHPLPAEGITLAELHPVLVEALPVVEEPAAEAILFNNLPIAHLLRDRASIGRIVEAAERREVESNFQAQTLERTVPFTFDPQLEQNRAVYAAITASDTLSQGWIDTGFGLIRASSFTNTVYRLPDEIRLAYNARMGAPYMIPHLYRDSDGEPKVRVTLGAVPWHDPAKLVELRDYLHRNSGGSLAAPTVIAGGYDSASLSLTSAFPEGIRTLSDTEMAVDLEDGFQFNLDLSQEYYRFLAELLTGPVGLTGEVTVTLKTEAIGEEGAAAEIQRRVPVRLNLSDLADLPVDIQVAKDDLKPKKVEVANLCNDSLRLARCVPQLLLVDDNSVVPLGILPATTVAPPFPVELQAGQKVEVSIEPVDGEGAALWNAVGVELIGKSLLRTPDEVLEKIHELMPDSTLEWNVKVECPLYQQPTLPEQYANLFKIEVQIQRPGMSAVQAVLGRDEAVVEVALERSLQEIVSADAASLAKYRYRVRNIYYDHQGAWSAEKEEDGSTLFVFPNPPAGD